MIVPNNNSGRRPTMPITLQAEKESMKGLVINEKSELVLRLDIGYGRMLLDMFAIIEENGALNKEMAELYDLLKRQIPQ